MPLLHATFARLLLAIDGSAFYHAGAYYANADDADRQRLQTARRLLALSDVRRAQAVEVLEARARGESSCVWCGYSIAGDRSVIAFAGRLIHQRDACSGEYERWTAQAIRITAQGRNALLRLDTPTHEAIRATR